MHPKAITVNQKYPNIKEKLFNGYFASESSWNIPK